MTAERVTDNVGLLEVCTTVPQVLVGIVVRVVPVAGTAPRFELTRGNLIVFEGHLYHDWQPDPIIRINSRISYRQF